MAEATTTPAQDTEADVESGTAAAEAADAGPSGLDAGTYEVLRSRLGDQAAELARRAEALNARRLETFGSTQLALIGTERVRTEHNCVPRDILSINGLMLFGYNVFIGLKPETSVGDVFSVHRFTKADTSTGDGEHAAFRFEDADVSELPGLLDDEQFERDFHEMYRYYRETRLLQLRQTDGRILAVFQTGPNISDLRVLRWRYDVDGTITYLDNRGERDHTFPSAHDFEWVETTRENHVLGRHPHISILDTVFVETVGGQLTIKLENNTESGEGIYSETVEDPLQSLADADVYYARVGDLILLRIRPYNESEWRYFVFNTKTKGIVRLDGIGQACLRLPEDHGVIFPGGYYLATGSYRTFDADVSSLEFKRVLRSPNGEDVMYAFYAQEEGRTLLLPYNVIRKEVAAPISCHGFSLFDDGTLVALRATSEEPTRVHPMQVWQTPFVSETYAAAQPVGTGRLEQVGNADLVRGISDCLSITRMVGEMAPSTPVFEAIITACGNAFDHYTWLGEQDLENLREPLSAIRNTAEQVLDEFETVQALTSQAADALSEAEADIATLIRHVRGESPRAADTWIDQLSKLRRSQGHLTTLREMRYVDTERIDELSAQLDDELRSAAERTVAFMERPEAFDAYHAEVDKLVADPEGISTAAEAQPITERLTRQSTGMELLTEVIGSLDIADATVRTQILERIAEVLAGVNRARATLEGRQRELLATEGRAEFAAEFALLGQAVTGALGVADTPEACDEQLGRLMLQIENLESRFGQFDDFATELATKRDDVYEAFSSRKQTLLDERSRRADRLADSAERILSSVSRRVASLDSLDDVNTYFASDPMIARLRTVIQELREIGDQVRAEELDGRIKAARQEAGRSLRDRLDLYGEGGETIRLGRHQFAVNTQPIDLTLVPHDGELAFTVTGTDYRAPVTDERLRSTRRFWDQLLVSESPEVYRAEHLAAEILAAAETGADGLSLDGLTEAAVSDDGLLPIVRQAVEARYDEGYERGVHDHDAALILDAVLRLYTGAELLRYPPAERATAQLFWAFGADDDLRGIWSTRARSLARARRTFASASPVSAWKQLRTELAERMTAFAEATELASSSVEMAAEYLIEELATTQRGFAAGAGARRLVEKFRRALGTQARTDYEADLRALTASATDAGLAAAYQLVRAWLESFVATSSDDLDADVGVDLAEAVAIELTGAAIDRYESSATLTTAVEGLLGAHRRIQERRLRIRLEEFLARTRAFRTERVPAYREYQRIRGEAAAAERARLRLEEYHASVMNGFVRNRLLDEVYLPLIGDNLAKQLGAAGDSRRTDQSGLLMLISPPGYGKTTLMEYVAARLGLVFVKVNGPALGHNVTSIDPDEAPNATARQEVEKISFALELGNNVLLYLDDIQHTSPELLQKFISLCDAQRRMEGVWNGQTRTYDLRGKRFAVCMAGNPYTEEGKRFRVPDMLANRADVWNLGDVLSGRDEQFALSYIENALTSNPVLAPLSTRERGDVDLLVRLAKGDESVRPDQLSHPYSTVELDQILAVLRKLIRVQEVVLANNQAYIASAAQADASRTEPPFLLQGSYRNMNSIAERIVPAMNDEELESVIDDHYVGEAQTLTSGAEANLLKLAELRGRLSEEQSRRWADVKSGFQRARALGGDGDDPMSRAVGAMGLLADRMGAVETAIDRAADRIAGDSEDTT